EAPAEVRLKYEQKNGKPTGNIVLNLNNGDKQPHGFTIIDNAYKTGSREKLLDARSMTDLVFDTSKSFGWYDFSMKMKDNSSFERRYAGRVETGIASKTDPLMGKIV
ncbi:MAG TPA: phospholipase domain-containing protein, partial [Chitinophagaceae bacterium]